eukprot:CAMPEP_0206478460 /NCGR_PEP_ID=MMETSP0324_2-20121206/36047_1 /ASSEMBLY_ACC=CAM_ASM_000836 /TAXON_ID=2866 /ORGANISM="Crypthecodinium cohnii, Strain Seligo" /LENGTH=277 /DNA_ID=CAMNT_0053954731 /DNA_START=176 /DNA_END=1009 /DNA_ORIENTATION=+
MVDYAVEALSRDKQAAETCAAGKSGGSSASSGGGLLRRVPLGELPPKPPNTTRFVIVSDTHERHREVALPEGDVFLHCGDILMSSSLTSQSRGLRVLRDFNDWLGSVPCQERLVIGGNHDWALEKLSEDEQKELLSNAILLHNRSKEVAGTKLKVYGNPHSRGHSHNQAWQGEPQVAAAQAAEADIVMSHFATGEVKEAVLETPAFTCRPLLWASGHAHEYHGAFEQDGTLFVNAAIANSRYEPIQPPIVVDIMNTEVRADRHDKQPLTLEASACTL